MDLLSVGFLRIACARFPEVNSQNNQDSEPEDSEPTESDPRYGHPFALQTKRLASNLPEPDITKNHGGDGADTPYPEQAAYKAAHGEAVGYAWGKEDRRRIGIEGGIESGVKPPLAMAALEGRVLELQSAIGTRFQNGTPRNAQFDYSGGLSSFAGPALLTRITPV
jgi:hypothetical protein